MFEDGNEGVKIVLQTRQVFVGGTVPWFDVEAWPVWTSEDGYGIIKADEAKKYLLSKGFSESNVRIVRREETVIV